MSTLRDNGARLRSTKIATMTCIVFKHATISPPDEATKKRHHRPSSHTMAFQPLTCFSTALALLPSHFPPQHAISQDSNTSHTPTNKHIPKTPSTPHLPKWATAPPPAHNPPNQYTTTAATSPAHQPQSATPTPPNPENQNPKSQNPIPSTLAILSHRHISNTNPTHA